ncbi:MAG: glutamine synthetase type III, partial [Candidatus Omnitrophica bacterium]|nr:glutamine synthetase type III [Candidatus Omnitrophota bacterium]
MEVMQRVAKRHGLACLLHEKPFSGINGSGKHNNWSVTGPDGKNWFSPGDNPHENERFLIMVAAVLKAVDEGAALLRAGVASAANDHRLGSHEAPPAIISVYLGEQLTDIIEQIEKGGARSSKEGGTLEVGVNSLPVLPRHASDRNRTSPFAFTGSKFEFRAVGSSMSLAGPNVILNTIVADALAWICTELEKASGQNINKAVQKVLQDIIKKHKRVIFNGDNYTEEWAKEAKKRGLPNLKTTPEALAVTKDPKAIALFERHGVLTRTELASRYDVYMETYNTTLKYEADLAAQMAKNMIMPAVLSYQGGLAETIKAVETSNKGKVLETRKILKEVTGLTETAWEQIAKLEKAGPGGSAEKIKAAMEELRETIDTLEGYVPVETWPLPSYAEMLFLF